MTEQQAIQLVKDARDTYFFLNNAWQIARAEELEEAARLERTTDRAWERMLRRGKFLSAVRMQGILS